MDYRIDTVGEQSFLFNLDINDQEAKTTPEIKKAYLFLVRLEWFRKTHPDLRIISVVPIQQKSNHITGYMVITDAV